ncbi:hypothetical protein SB861_33100 [Paraburkholderia sp. SIMBA_049]
MDISLIGHAARAPPSFTIQIAAAKVLTDRVLGELLFSSFDTAL